MKRDDALWKQTLPEANWRFENKELISKFGEELNKITSQSNTMGLKEFVLDRERRVGRKEGREEGREEGIATGMSMKESEYKTDFTKSLLLQTDFPDEKIATLANVEVEYVKKMRASLA